MFTRIALTALLAAAAAALAGCVKLPNPVRICVDGAGQRIIEAGCENHSSGYAGGAHWSYFTGKQVRDLGVPALGAPATGGSAAPVAGAAYGAAPEGGLAKGGHGGK